MIWFEEILYYYKCIDVMCEYAQNSLIECECRTTTKSCDEQMSSSCMMRRSMIFSFQFFSWQFVWSTHGTYGSNEKCEFLWNWCMPNTKAISLLSYVNFDQSSLVCWRSRMNNAHWSNAIQSFSNNLLFRQPTACVRSICIEWLAIFVYKIV